VEFTGFVEGEHVAFVSEDVGDGCGMRRAELRGFTRKSVEFYEEPGTKSTPDVPSLLHPVPQRAEGNTRHLDFPPSFPRQRFRIPHDDRLGVTQRQIKHLYHVRGEDKPVPADGVPVDVMV
jgi:hypothetical protein